MTTYLSDKELRDAILSDPTNLGVVRDSLTSAAAFAGSQALSKAAGALAPDNLMVVGPQGTVVSVLAYVARRIDPDFPKEGVSLAMSGSRLVALTVTAGALGFATGALGVGIAILGVIQGSEDRRNKAMREEILASILDKLKGIRAENERKRAAIDARENAPSTDADDADGRIFLTVGKESIAVGDVTMCRLFLTALGFSKPADVGVSALNAFLLVHGRKVRAFRDADDRAAFVAGLDKAAILKDLEWAMMPVEDDIPSEGNDVRLPTSSKVA